ncbi:MAG TPA: hypothetical protein VLV83_21930 [Acidobacteriota bacterium]|nr:hypothetical protein [Acidobacteriota bacterium]
MNRTLRSLTLALSFLALSVPLWAGGALNLNPNDPDGVSRWANGGVDIPYNMDLSGLGPLSNAQARQMVLDALQILQDIPTASQTYSDAGDLAVDVDITNFTPFVINLFLDQNNSDGLSPVVFDVDGSIFTFLFGQNSSILGFASPDTFDANGVPIEGVAFLNGGSLLDGFPLDEYFGVAVHEFGHYSGLAHSVVNGESVLFGDESGPSPQDTFGPAPVDTVTTMYPIAIVGSERDTLHADDIAMMSYLYPEPGYLEAAGFIRGRIELPDDAGPVTGVNVIARNLADPFADAFSSISGDQGEPGVYTLRGLTPGAQYVIFVDLIDDGGFTIPPVETLPGREEFYNGASESDNILTVDDPLDFVAVVPAGGLETGFDIFFNAPGPGDILPVGDDDTVEIFLPFPFTICESSFRSVFVNANGNITFGTPSLDVTESAEEMTSGPPRVAGLWDDLDPSSGGTVTFDIRNTGGAESVVVTWDDVPEFFLGGSNTFSIALQNNNKVTVEYGFLTAFDGLAGVTCGGELASGLEPEINLTSSSGTYIDLKQNAAVYEQFSFDNDLDHETILFDAKTQFKDSFEKNDSVLDATSVSQPFDTADTRSRFSDIHDSDDVDYYRFAAAAGSTILAEVISGDLDTVLGLYRLSGTGSNTQWTLVAVNDDGGVGLLSRLDFEVETGGDYALAVSTFPDFDFNGGGDSSGRYVLSIDTINGFLLSLGDDDFVEVDLGFSFPFQGSSYDSVWVNSNGSLTFGAGDPDFSPSVSEFLNEQPRIAPLWVDLSPNQGGLIITQRTAGSTTIAFQGVPQFNQADNNNFAVTLSDDGNISVEYGEVDASFGLAGISQGGGAADPGETDLSAAGSLSANGTAYELFTFFNVFDMASQSLFFVP